MSRFSVQRSGTNIEKRLCNVTAALLCRLVSFDKASGFEPTDFFSCEHALSIYRADYSAATNNLCEQGALHRGVADSKVLQSNVGDVPKISCRVS